MDHLWAPWRLAFVVAAAANAPRKLPDECFICKGLAEDRDRENLIAYRGERSCVVLNKFPYNNGHLLIAPLVHLGNLEDLSPEVMLELQETIRRCIRRLDAVMRPEGYNVGLNLGRVAGAGLPGHLHWHVVPRWNGDTNFMPVLGDTKVISQSLEALYDLLAGELR